jgi:hypothetical protein
VHLSRPRSGETAPLNVSNLHGDEVLSKKLSAGDFWKPAERVIEPCWFYQLTGYIKSGVAEKSLLETEPELKA